MIQNLKNSSSSTFTLGLASSFSGGLFLAAGLFHILPEANEAIGKYYKDQKTYPWVYLAAIASYYFILFIDKVCFDSHAHGDKDNNLMENIKHEFYLNLKLNITNQMNQKKVICSGHMTPLSSVVLDTDPNNKDNTRFVNDEIDEEIFKAMVSRKAKLVTSMSCLPKRKSSQYFSLNLKTKKDAGKKRISLAKVVLLMKLNVLLIPILHIVNIQVKKVVW